MAKPTDPEIPPDPPIPGEDPRIPLARRNLEQKQQNTELSRRKYDQAVTAVKLADTELQQAQKEERQAKEWLDALLMVLTSSVAENPV
jgi:hypothetical protein